MSLFTTNPSKAVEFTMLKSLILALLNPTTIFVIAAVVGLIALLAIYFGLGHAGLILIVVAISTAAYYEFLVFSGAAEKSKLLPLAVGATLSAWLCAETERPGLWAARLAAMSVMGSGTRRLERPLSRNGRGPGWGASS